MKARNLISSSLVFLAGACTPQTVKEFQAIDNKEGFLDIQKEIYSFRDRKIPNELVDKVEQFYGCSENKALDFINAQARIYLNFERLKEERRSEKVVPGWVLLNSNSMFSYEKNFKDSFRELKYFYDCLGLVEQSCAANYLEEKLLEQVK